MARTSSNSWPKRQHSCLSRRPRRQPRPLPLPGTGRRLGGGPDHDLGSRRAADGHQHPSAGSVAHPVSPDSRWAVCGGAEPTIFSLRSGTASPVVDFWKRGGRVRDGIPGNQYLDTDGRRIFVGRSWVELDDATAPADFAKRQRSLEWAWSATYAPDADQVKIMRDFLARPVDDLFFPAGCNGLAPRSVRPTGPRVPSRHDHRSTGCPSPGWLSASNAQDRRSSRWSAICFSRNCIATLRRVGTSIVRSH